MQLRALSKFMMISTAVAATGSQAPKSASMARAMPSIYVHSSLTTAASWNWQTYSSTEINAKNCAAARAGVLQPFSVPDQTVTTNRTFILISSSVDTDYACASGMCVSPPKERLHRKCRFPFRGRNARAFGNPKIETKRLCKRCFWRELRNECQNESHSFEQKDARRAPFILVRWLN